jgi:hypothetical protein
MAKVVCESPNYWDLLDEYCDKLASKLDELISNHWGGLFCFMFGVTCAKGVIDESFNVSAVLEKARPMKCMAKVIPLLEGIVRFRELEKLISHTRRKVSTQVELGCNNYFGKNDISYFDDLSKSIVSIAYTEQLIEKINRQIVNCYGGDNDEDFQIYMDEAVRLMQEVMELESECKTIALHALAEPAKN